MYRRDLAAIHHAGFSQFAEESAPGILELLWKQGIADGLVVEAGCGSGILTRELTRSGFRVHAFDASAAMIDLARIAAPAASFEVVRYEEAALPRCRAVISIGEVLNYGSLPAFRDFAARVSAALEAGGLFLFDAAETGAYPARDEVRVGGDDWSVIAVKESDGHRLVRRVFTFRDLEGSVARDEETHELELFDREVLKATLRSSGFRVQVRRSWGAQRLPKGHAAYVARKK